MKPQKYWQDRCMAAEKYLKIAFREDVVQDVKDMYFRKWQAAVLSSQDQSLTAYEKSKEEQQSEKVPVHKCKYCEAMTEQPDEVCWNNPDRQPTQEPESNHDDKCFHECPDCNNRCNCDGASCSCCNPQEPESKEGKTRSAMNRIHNEFVSEKINVYTPEGKMKTKSWILRKHTEKKYVLPYFVGQNALDQIRKDIYNAMDEYASQQVSKATKDLTDEVERLMERIGGLRNVMIDLLGQCGEPGFKCESINIDTAIKKAKQILNTKQDENIY